LVLPPAISSGAGKRCSGFPKASPEVDKSMGMWGFWMPGFMQFITGTYLLVGLTWFNVFGNTAPLYMAGLAFTAHGIHWFAMAHRRYIDSSAQPDGWMAIAFTFIGILGIDVFRRAGDIPVMILFVGLTFDLRHRDSYPAFLLGARHPPRGFSSVGHRNLASVLHIRHHSRPRPRSQGMGLMEKTYRYVE
jgi:hypothetical protein